MNIGILSDCRFPTLPIGGHGLGRMAIDLCHALAARKHTVTLYAGPGSNWNGKTVIHDTETNRANTLQPEPGTIYIDLSHLHEWSAKHPDAMIYDWVVDGECPRVPERVIVSTGYDKQVFPTAQVVPAGVDTDKLKPVKHPTLGYLAFCAKIHMAKGYQIALEVHQRQFVPVRFCGERWVTDWLPDWRPVLNGEAYREFLGNALGLIHPLNDHRALGGGRIMLEAAALGVPALVFDDVSCRDHVAHTISGFLCKDQAEMIDAVNDLQYIDRDKCRAWACDTHSLDVMAQALEKVIEVQHVSTA